MATRDSDDVLIKLEAKDEGGSNKIVDNGVIEPRTVISVNLEVNEPEMQEIGGSASEDEFGDEDLDAIMLDIESEAGANAAGNGIKGEAIKSEDSNQDGSEFDDEDIDDIMKDLDTEDIKAEIKTCSSTTTTPTPKATKIPEYRINFGKTHQGKTLSQLPESYIDYLLKNEVAKYRHDLKVALDLYVGSIVNSVNGTVSKPPLPVPARWTGLRLPDAYIFIDEWTEEPLWISARDALNYFRMDNEHLNQLAPLKGTGKTKRYYLRHVWDLYNFLVNEKDANRCLANFLQNNEDREGEIAREMSIGSGMIDVCPSCGMEFAAYCCWIDYIRENRQYHGNGCR